ncbi:hypothetical protein [Bradyrhizobium sp. UFLA05-112]
MYVPRSAFASYLKESDPEWRSPSWIGPSECSHLANMIMRELNINGFNIAKKLGLRVGFTAQCTQGVCRKAAPRLRRSPTR